MTALMESASDYRDAYRKTPRPLAIALGQVLANTPFGAVERQQLLARLFSTLRPGDKLRCQRELHACRHAKRGQLMAVVGQRTAP